MKKIRVNLGVRSYSILIGRNLLNSVGWLIKPFCPGSKVLIVTNRRVGKFFLTPVQNSLRRAGFQAAPPFFLPQGNERDKSEKVLSRLWQHMAKSGLERSSTVLALGGGVVGDLAGFAASTYMRGISVVQVPTTLLAQVDASIGGKTGIDLTSAKNIVGSFHQPRMVFIDITALKKLSRWEFINGFAEVIKYGVIQDRTLFQMLERSNKWCEPSFLETVVFRSARVKAQVVSQDEKETRGKRMILNYGHTFAHAFEAASNYRLPHGEAVALGMVSAARLAVRRGIFRPGDERRQNQLIRMAGLPTRLKRGLPLSRIFHHMALDKKKKSGRLRFILPTSIGHVRIVEGVPLAEVRKVLHELAEA